MITKMRVILSSTTSEAYHMLGSEYQTLCGIHFEEAYFFKKHRSGAVSYNRDECPPPNQFSPCKNCAKYVRALYKEFVR